MIERTGNTGSTRYRLIPVANRIVKKKKIEATGNGVIDAKLRKEAGLSTIPSSLEQLIDSATLVGVENECLKQGIVY